MTSLAPCRMRSAEASAQKGPAAALAIVLELRARICGSYNFAEPGRGVVFVGIDPALAQAAVAFMDGFEPRPGRMTPVWPSSGLMRRGPLGSWPRMTWSGWSSTPPTPRPGRRRQP
jgi:hypothetical protein